MKDYERLKNKKEWKRYLHNLLKTNDTALLRAVVIVYEGQTQEEVYSYKSLENNGVGFNKFDAEFLTGIAHKIKLGKKITDEEMYILRTKMPKYWRQLMKISKENIRKENEMRERKRAKQEVENKRKDEMSKCLEEGVPCSYGICSECELNAL